MSPGFPQVSFEQQRTTVEKLSVLMAIDGKLDQNSEEPPLATKRIQ
jgi:hypothetical protein